MYVQYGIQIIRLCSTSYCKKQTLENVYIPFNIDENIYYTMQWISINDFIAKQNKLNLYFKHKVLFSYNFCIQLNTKIYCLTLMYQTCKRYMKC
jgi:hypothetical protein